MMIQLIKKDVMFNLKWAILLVLISIMFPVVFIIDGDNRFVLFVYILGTMLANSHFVSKSCYLDDNMQTRRFLASLPVTKVQLILSKYLLGLLCIAVSLAFTSISSFALGLNPSVRGVLVASGYLLLYYAVFLGVFFRTNYSNAEKAHTSLLMLAVASLFVIDRSGISLEEMSIEPAAMIGGLMICMLIYAVSIFISISSFSHFQTGNAA